MKNNNLIPSLLIACGLIYVGANLNKEQETKVIQAEPVVAKTVASFTGVGDPVIVWYEMLNSSVGGGSDLDYMMLVRAWSDGTVEGKVFADNLRYESCQLFFSTCNKQQLDVISSDWFVISSTQMACRTDINGNGEIEFGDLLAVLSDWGTETTCPDVVQLQCGLLEMN